MHRTRRTLIVVAALAVAAGACSSKGGAAAKTTTTTAPSGVVLAVRPSSLGEVLTDGHGFTLYRFAADRNGSVACIGGCTQQWPPLTVPPDTKPSAAAGAAGTVATLHRPDGSDQVTYNGAPLYRYVNDHSPGDTNGDGIGGAWHAVKP